MIIFVFGVLMMTTEIGIYIIWICVRNANYGVGDKTIKFQLTRSVAKILLQVEKNYEIEK